MNGFVVWSHVREVGMWGCAAWIVVGFATGVEARPVRGPVGRAERRVARAQALLDRELARPPGRPRGLQAADPALPPRREAAAAGTSQPARAPLPAASPQSGVAPATFQAPTPAAEPPSAGSEGPAEDGTVSVLVRPGGNAAQIGRGRPAEPLRFPDGQAP